MTLQEYNDLYKRPLLKQMTIVSSGGITIKNANIVSEEMSLEKSLCSETNLRYGRCEAACFKVRIADINHDFTGEWLTVTQDVVTDSEGYLLTQNGQYLLTEDGFKIKLKNEQIDEASAVYGRFRVHSDKPSNDRRWRDLTCYDIMYDILNADVISWYNGLTFPMTLKNLRDSFFAYLGITQETTTLINDSFVTPGGFSVSGSLSGKTVIESICELNGVFGQITGDGKFQYVSLSSPPTLTLDYYVDGTGSYEDYVTDAVTGINAKGTTNDVGTIVGTDTNLYIIANNPLIYGTEGTTALTTALNTLLRHITAIQFRPFKVTTYGNPMLPLGTQITLNTKNQIIVSYVVRKELNGIQSLKDTISATSDKHQPTAVNSPVTEIKRSQGKIHELEINVDGLTSRVSATETNLSNNYSTTNQMNTAIQQSASAITTQVSNTYVTKTTYNAEIQNLQDQIDGRIEYFDGNVVPTLNNPPASTWTTTAEKDSHVGDLYRYHYTDQGAEKTDYYRFDKDTTTNPPTYSWVTLGESEADEALRQAELANQKADAAQAQLDDLQEDIEDNYSTTTQMNSAINQKANEITQTVSTTYETKSDATSKFNTADANAQGYANDALSTANTNAQEYANTALTTARSEITQLSNKVAVKVNSSGRLVTAELGVDPASSTSYLKVKADDIDIISNGNIQLTGKSIGISSTYFSVGTDGTISATKGTVGGWKITSTDIYDASADTSGSTGAGIGKNGTTYAFWAGADYTSRNSAPFRVGHGGQLIASNATITGTVTTSNLTATGGTVGGWSVSSDKLYGGSSDYYCAMLKPTSTAKYSFVSGASNTTYDDAAFRVLPTGTVIAKTIYVTSATGNSISDLLTGKNGIWMYGSNSGSSIWFSDPNSSTPGFHATMIFTGSSGAISCRQLSCSGTKKRIVKTEDYGTRSLYCYETPTPMFGDIGEGKIAEDGKCYIWLDSTFSETIKTESYQVFLQKYGQGECYVTERNKRYFVVEGTPNMTFGWELKARQAGFENERLENYIEPEIPKDTIDYAEEAIKHFNTLRDERMVA